MANPFTNLRREVLLDLVKEVLGTTTTTSPGGAGGMIESGGSGAQTGGGSSTSPTENLSNGVDYLVDPIDVANFPDAVERFGNIDLFLEYLVAAVVMPLRVMPDIGGPSNCAITVRSTEGHPVYFFGVPFVYAGATLDLLPSCPAVPTPSTDPAVEISVLVVLDPAYATITTNPAGALSLVTDPVVVADVTQWPTDKIPLGVVALSSDFTLDPTYQLDLEHITDVRPFLTFGNKTRWVEQNWQSVTVTGTRRYDFDAGIFPITPYTSYLKVTRNGVELEITSDYSVAFDGIAQVYYVLLTFDIVAGENLKAWFIRN